MMIYRAFFFREDGAAAHTERLEADSDSQAVEMASALMHEWLRCELWQDDRIVVTLPIGD